MAAFIRQYGELNADGSYVLSTADHALITSILSPGTVVGALAGSTIGDGVGRRYGIIIYICVYER